MKNKYSIEAFALSVVLFSGAHGKAENMSLKDAVIVGVLIVVCAALGALIRKDDTKGNKTTAAVVCALAFVALAFGAYKFIGLYADWLTYVKFAAVGVLCGKAAYSADGEATVNDTVWKASMAYAVFMFIAAFREFASFGSVFAVKLTESTLVSAAYGKISFGLISAGCFAALANVVTKDEAENCGVTVAAAAIVTELVASFTIGSGIVPACVLAVLTAAAFVSIRDRNVFSAAPKPLRAMPINLAGLGIAFMVLANVSSLL